MYRIILFCLTISSIAYAEQPHHSPYAGQQQYPIKSLSPVDIAELKRGGGWGLAKTAELNGWPGPRHVLELAAELKLNKTQIQAITELFDTMQTQAITQGEQLIALEQELEQQFQQRTVTAESLSQQLEKIAAARSQLRYIHLSTHLQTPAMLGTEQMQQYNLLRGYTNPAHTHYKQH